MTRLTPRLRWRQAVASDQFPRTERVIRGTLLCLVELMAPTGEMSVYREQVGKVTGLPLRTIDRHLARAVAAGWLIHQEHGGNGRRSLYLAAVPAPSSAPLLARYSTPEEGSSAPSTRGLLPGSSAPTSGALNKESASGSELQALDDQRGRRTDHDGSRGTGPHHPPKSSSDGKRAARLSLVPADPSAVTTQTGDARPCA